MENALKQRAQFSLCLAQIQEYLQLFFYDHGYIQRTGFPRNSSAEKLPQDTLDPVPDDRLADLFGDSHAGTADRGPISTWCHENYKMCCMVCTPIVVTGLIVAPFPQTERTRIPLARLRIVHAPIRH